jgi:hypothetical protein
VSGMVGAVGANIRGGPENTTHVTNYFQISGASEPEKVAQKVSEILMGQLSSARQMQVGM